MQLHTSVQQRKSASTMLPAKTIRQLAEKFSIVKNDAEHAARQAGLRYVSDQSPGIARKRATRQGKAAFRYLDADGKPVRDKALLARIKSLVIPPAWTDVWICPWDNGHIQVTARDARQRKQYRYHQQWREVRDEAKYGQLLQFGPALPLIRESVAAALAKPGLSRDKVLAAVISLLESTNIRVGNDEYARTNNSFGLTTLQNKHVRVTGTSIAFEFRGKSGVKHAISLRDPRLSRIIKRMRELPGQELFQYLDEQGQRHALNSADVNDYLHNVTGEQYTAKDFRTWSGTVLAAL
uniref:DNA topoisomerase IB n=1 Tax=Undibacterium sp. TaxID=1914977 RepID=UPI00374CD966